ncbi:hypothetical protein AUJ84_02075 [Candidatus Pacearchaeota archaeon CG1_02_32_132]|nr:MAG: hypothetical protein AUJ84_02075 [Candidatus Pacearchaeota archaeon CG1_02_32_132]
MSKILVTAKQAGSVNALVEPVKELMKRGHDVVVYATGNEAEAKGFGLFNAGINKSPDYNSVLDGVDLLISGLSGTDTPDSQFIRTANRMKIPSIGVNDQNTNYAKRFSSLEDLPSAISLMDGSCLSTMLSQLETELGAEASKRAVVIGWTALDRYAAIRNGFSSSDRERLIKKLGEYSGSKEGIFFHATQNVKVNGDSNFFDYELKVTEKVFQMASDLGKALTVKPHPREEAGITKNFAERFGHAFLPPEACSTLDLILLSDSVTAGRSTCLTEACLLDKNTGGILPEIRDEELIGYPPVQINAIPYTQRWSEISDILEKITSANKQINAKLAENRKRFSVDGKASERLASLAEKIIS